MIRSDVPAYFFDFGLGISSVGRVVRACARPDAQTYDQIIYSLDDCRLAGLGVAIPSIVADLIDVSVAVYIADRLAPRELRGDHRQKHDRWHRRFRLRVPVRSPGVWSNLESIEILQELLCFLTDDAWELEFTARSHDKRQSESQVSYLTSSHVSTSVLLNSGGLDSLLGIAELLSRVNTDRILPVTVMSNRAIRLATEGVLNVVRQIEMPGAPIIQPVEFRIRISGEGRPRDDKESSQRARAMFFLALGTATAIASGTNQLHVCENGIGAIGLPMTSDHWGSRATKAMHPRTLALFSRLTSVLLDRPFSVQNLGLLNTKGKLVRELVSGPFVEAAKHTVSCDRAAYLELGHACGRCTSCILRRVSLMSAGVSDIIDGTTLQYDVDLLDPAVTWTPENSRHLIVMRHQVENLRSALGTNMGFDGLLWDYPDLINVMDVSESLGISGPILEQRLLNLYATYVAEFVSFTSHIDRLDWGREAAISVIGSTGNLVAAS